MVVAVLGTYKKDRGEGFATEFKDRAYRLKGKNIAKMTNNAVSRFALKKAAGYVSP
mgnify:FL=1